MYVSKPVEPITTYVTTSILEASGINNKKAEITGVLCQGSGIYMQVIEGKRSAISALFARIMADKRHNTVELLCMEEINQRRYAQWSMALVPLSMDDPMVQMAHPEFDPYSASSADAMKIIDDLIKSGSPIQT
jgi:inosine/xanthosine triphosphate pyrophosphatase family protein